MREKSQVGLETEIEEREGHVVVSVRGRLTIDTTPDLLYVFRRVLKRTSMLKVDLRGVRYMDSSGISVLIQGLRMSQRRSVVFVLVEPSPKVMGIIELSQLQNFFNIETTARE